jgi:hypothetical protein
MGGPFGGGFGSPFGGGMGGPFGGGFGSPGGMRGFQNREMPQPAVMPNTSMPTTFVTPEPTPDVMPSTSMPTTFDLKPDARFGGFGGPTPDARFGSPLGMVPAAQGYENYQYQPGSGRLGQIPPGMMSGLASLLRGFR